MAAIASTSCAAIMQCGVAFIHGLGQSNEPIRTCVIFLYAPSRCASRSRDAAGVMAASVLAVLEGGAVKVAPKPQNSFKNIATASIDAKERLFVAAFL